MSKLTLLLLFFLMEACTMESNAKKDTSKLTPLQFQVTQQCGTEPPFNNAYWDNHRPGIYVDIVSGEPLFSSLDKFDSGTGWPSFAKPLEDKALKFNSDFKIGAKRTEVKSSKAGSHLGHVFDDGPGPDGKRYCINSASLRFIAAEDLEKEGYGQYAKLFTATSSKKSAIFGGGCFWGVEEILRKIPGVLNTSVGYSGGLTENPTYEDVSTGTTGHAEVVRIEYDSAKIKYEDLLEFFFRLHDPTTLNQQGPDRGTQYRSVIFYGNEAEKKTAETARVKINKSGKWKSKVVTEIVPTKKFFEAEPYHQDYLQKHPGHYSCHFLRD